MIIFTNRFKLATLSIFFILLSFNSAFSQTGKVRGTIYDKDSGDPLWGANVFIDGTSLGAASDMEGTYLISVVPAGNQILTVKYIGYQEQQFEINVETNKTLIVDVELNPEIIEGEEVVITAQAAGQMAAINQQISAKSIKNVVSSARIQELPDATAAESVGRLPGVSINRSGGEANKVTVRGLAPRYNNVQLDGVTMGSTDLNNRSTDISMISPNALAGIEVTKAPTADMEANSLGGTVNLTMREAPNDFYYDLLLQGGYDSQQKSYDNYKIVGSISNRFLDNRLGIYFNGYLEERNRSTDVLNPSFIEDFRLPEDQRDEKMRFDGINYVARNEARDRIGGTLVLDYKLPFGKLKMSNFFSRMDRDILQYNQRYSGEDGLGWNQSVNISGKNIQSQMMNKLLGEFEDPFGGKLEVGLSYSYSLRDQPESKGYNAYATYVLPVELRQELHYLEYVNNVKQFGFGEGGTDIHLGNFNTDKFYGEDKALSAKLDYEYPINLGDFANINLKIGGLFKRQDRLFERLDQDITIDRNEYSFVQFRLMDAFPDVWPNRNNKGQPFLPDVWDDHFDNDKFFDGDYDIYPFMNLDVLRQTYDFVFNDYDKNGYLPNTGIQTFTKDQDGFEETTSFYFMTEISMFDNTLTLLPGARLEKVNYEYTGLQIDVPLGGNLKDWNAIKMMDTTATTTHENWFPMIHLRFRPVEWGDLRIAYTETVSRPNYTDLTPYLAINANTKTIDGGNLELRPQISKNWDVNFSIYSNHIGLLTVGGFYKSIDDLIWRSDYFLPTTEDAIAFGLPERYKSYTYFAAQNSRFEAEITGFELSWQNNLWFLPTPFDGIVFDINYTIIDSETRYPFPFLIDDRSVFPPGKIRIDSSYSGPIAGQPKNVLNFSIGYDYKGFSSRLSYLYQDGSLSNVDQKEYLSTFGFAYDRWDLKISQKLPYQIEVFFNMSNLTDTPDESYIQRTQYIDNRELWGLTADLGVRYRL